MISHQQPNLTTSRWPTSKRPCGAATTIRRPQGGNRSMPTTVSTDYRPRHLGSNGIEDCRRFQEENAADLARYDHPQWTAAELGGHDFWLTRNGHGCGFWDRNDCLPEEAGDRLTAAAEKCGEYYRGRWRRWNRLHRLKTRGVVLLLGAGLRRPAPAPNPEVARPGSRTARPGRKMNHDRTAARNPGNTYRHRQLHHDGSGPRLPLQRREQRAGRDDPGNPVSRCLSLSPDRRQMDRQGLARSLPQPQGLLQGRQPSRPARRPAKCWQRLGPNTLPRIRNSAGKPSKPRLPMRWSNWKAS